MLIQFIACLIYQSIEDKDRLGLDMDRQVVPVQVQAFFLLDRFPTTSDLDPVQLEQAPELVLLLGQALRPEQGPVQERSV